MSHAHPPGAACHGCIDVHHHFLPPAYVTAMGAERLMANSRRSLRSPLDWTPAHSLAEMEAHGVQTAMLSIADGGVWLDDAATSAHLARTCNEFAARARVDHPGRFGAFAALPLPDVDAALAEAAYALDILGADGVGLLTCYGDRWLGDAAFVPLFDELNRRGAVVYVHPTGAMCTPDLGPPVPAAAIEFPHHTTRTIVSLLFSGTFRRCPDIRFVFSHAGGTLPYIARRVLSFAADPDLGRAIGGDAMAQLRALYFDVVSASDFQVDALMKLADATHLLFGSDYPFAPGMMGQTLANLEKWGLAPDVLRAIRRDNALRLFPRLV